ncbi:MAG: transporter substrate-binding domain-containing protein [Alphaproteobacteria bacterium]
MISQRLRDALAPTGTLRAGLNLSNFLLVSGQNADGTPAGVSPDLARHIAAALDVPCEFVLFETPGQLADAVADDVWDICNIAHEPDRARQIDFSQPYVLIDANFLVRTESAFTSNEDIDQKDVKIIAFYRSAYDLWLRDNLQHASLVAADSIQHSHDMFLRGEADVLASLKPRLQMELDTDRHRMIAPRFTAIKQAVGIKKTDPAVLQFLNDLINDAIENGFIKASLATHGVDDKLSLPERVG